MVGPDTFNRLFTMHGTTMVFLVGMPIIAGLSNYLVPLMIGARDMAFPRLNAFGFWIFLFGGMLPLFQLPRRRRAVRRGIAPDVGWFAYAPLTEQAFSRGHSTDYWILGILVSGVGSIASAINVIVTVISHALQGHDAGADAAVRLAHAGDVGMVILIALPPSDRRADHAAAGPLSRRELLQHAGRRLGGACGSTSSGSSAIPEVYILIFPAFACVSEIIPVFSRKPIFGYAGHGRRDGRDRLHQPGRLGAPHVRRRHDVRRRIPSLPPRRMLVGVPTGIKIFNWLATM